MNSLLSKFINKFFGEDLALSVQVFNLLGCAGTVAGVVVAGISATQKAGIVSVVLNLAAAALAVLLLTAAGKKIGYRAASWIVVAVVFMAGFPVLFFSAGGYRSGMPGFFIFAIIFTAILLDKKGRVFALAGEFALYVGCCLVAYLYPETVTGFAEERYYLSDVITGMVVSGTLLLLVILLHIRMYRVREAQINELNRRLKEKNKKIIQKARATRITLTRAIAEATEIVRGSLTLTLQDGKAFVNGCDAGLTQKEFAVLLLLVQNGEKTLTGEAIYESVWGATMNNDSTAIRAHISRLKKKLDDEGADDFSIISEPGKGYTFTTK